MLSERRPKISEELSWGAMLLIPSAVESTPCFQLAVKVSVSKAFRVTDALSNELPASVDNYADWYLH